MTQEIWKRILHSHYSVSSIGRVKNDKTGLTLKTWTNSKHYTCVDLIIDGCKRKFRVHRLVAESFIANPCNKPCVDHINTIPNDNRVENLRWVTHQENSRNPITLERLHRTTFKIGDANPKTMTGKFGLGNPRARPVKQLKNGRPINEFSCAREAMRKTGIDCCSITKCCRSQRKSAGGYQWVYVYE